MPIIVIVAERKLLKTSLGLVRFLIKRWSCSTILFRYLFYKQSILGVKKAYIINFDHNTKVMV